MIRCVRSLHNKWPFRGLVSAIINHKIHSTILFITLIIFFEQLLLLIFTYFFNKNANARPFFFMNKFEARNNRINKTMRLYMIEIKKSLIR